MNVRTALLAAALAAFAAPAFAGPPPASEKFTARYVHANLVVGETTREEVLERFGKPYETSEDVSSTSGLTERWVYNKNAQSARAQVGRAQSFLSRVTDVIGIHNPAGSAILDANSKVSSAQYKADAAGQILNGGQGRENKGIVVEFKDGIVSYFSFN